LDIEEAVIGVHRVGEHPTELQTLYGFRDVSQIVVDSEQRVVICFAARQLEQFFGIAQSGVDALQGADRVFEVFSFLAQVLCALLILPDRGVFDQGADFIQALLLGIEVKDTS